MSEEKASILGQVKTESYRNGFSQGSMIATDDAYTRGCNDTEESYKYHFTWGWIFGVVCGVFGTGLVEKFL